MKKDGAKVESERPGLLDFEDSVRSPVAGSKFTVKPIIASFCTYFLKAEMRHIYRQITSLQRVHTFVIAKYRENSELYPFRDLELLGSSNPNLVRRGRLKYLVRAPALVYRGEFEIIRRILVRRDPDLMHVYFGNTGVHLLPLIERWDRPCVISFHGMDVQRRKTERGYESNLRKVLRLVPLVLVRSRSIAQRLIDLDCDPQKIRLNRTGIPLSEFPYLVRSVPAQGAWTIIQACRLVPKKGLATALRAFVQFARAFPRSRFLIAGDGPLRRELEQLVEHLGLQKFVVFLGFLGPSQLREVYEKAHIFMHPSELPPDSNEEGIPNSMLEAMATGLPVVATRHGGIPEAVTDGVNGLLVPERDYEGLANSLVRLVEDPARWKTFGASASHTVAREFAQSRQIESLESAYLEVIERWGKKASA